MLSERHSLLRLIPTLVAWFKAKGDLGNDAFDEIRSEGRTLTVEQAVALALA